MPEDKGLGSKLLGLFVEVKEEPTEQAPAAKSPADIVAELAGQTAPAKNASPSLVPPGVASVPTGPAASTAVAIDFDAIFRNAGVNQEELDRVRKAEELLKGLPETTPLDVKRQIVEASLKAFGFDLAKIVAAAHGSLKALDTYVRLTEQQTAKSVADAQTNIGQLEEKVAALKTDIAKRREQFRAVSAAAEVRKNEVHRVIEFFKG
jgi:hypothetical protein